MPEEPIHQAHDKLFKTGFSDPTNAAGLLRNEIPATVAERIDWERLQLEPGSFIDSHFRQSESDLLFSAPIEGRDCLLYILFEHQISEDKQIALRLLRYMVRIWEARIKDCPGDPLPVILPVVLAQNDKVWNLAPEFSALLDLPSDLADALCPFIPDFHFRLLQLAEVPFESLAAIAGTPAGIMILRVMKAERSNSLLGDAVWDETILTKLPREIMELVIRYMLATDLDKDAFSRRVEAIQARELRDTTMTLADQFREEGLEKGLQKGRQMGLQDGILEALEIRFDHVPGGLAEAIRQIHDDARLRSLHRAAIKADSLEIFAKNL